MNPVEWQDMTKAPYGALLVLRTPYGVFLHSMLDRKGNVIPWEEQSDRHTDGKFDYEDVIAWVRLA